MEQITNKEILDRISQLEVKMNLIMERLPEEDSDDELLNQVKESLEDAKAGRIKRVA